MQMWISKGVIYMLFATLAFAIMNVMAKELSALHPMQVVFFRALGTFVFIFPYMIYRKIPVIGTHVKYLVLRAIMGVISLSCFFVVVQRIPLGSAISLRYLGPIFGAIMAYYFLKERIVAKQWFSFAIAFAGVIVMKGFDIRIDLLSFVLIMISAVSVGAVFVTLRFLGDKEHPLTIINYFMMFSMLFSLPFMGEWTLPVGDTLYLVCMIGIFGMIGQIFMTMAFREEEANVLAPFKYMELVYGIIAGYFIYQETYGLLPFLGIGLIIMGMIMNVRAKNESNSD